MVNEQNPKVAEEITKEVTEDKPDFEKKLDVMRAENAKMEANIRRLEELKAIDALSGKADVDPEPKKKEISDREYYEAAIKGEILK